MYKAPVPKRRYPKLIKKKEKAKKKELVTTIKKVHHTLVPSNQIRFVADVALTSQTGLANGFNWLELSGFFAQGTLYNQKTSPKMYVPGLKLDLTAYNGNPNASKFIRVMVVRNKNPADTLDVTGWTDLYENELFAPAVATGLQKDSVRPINTDVLAVHFDRCIQLPLKTERGIKKKYWIPIKRTWTFKTVSSSTNVSNGKTFLIIQAIDAQLTGALPATTADVSYFVRMYYKPTE